MEEKDIWTFPVNSKRNTICYIPESIRHPAKMCLLTCRKIIKLYSKKGELILDPMAGIGSTIIEGMILGRNVIGVEYEKKFVDLAEKNIVKTKKSMKFMNTLGNGKIIKGDSRELSKLKYDGDIDSVIFSPPFADSLAGSSKDDTTKFSHGSAGKDYGDDPENIGNKSGKNYLTEMLKIYQECFKVLKPEGFMALVTKNFVRKGEQIRLDLDTIKLCESAGFSLHCRHYRLIKNPSFWITNAIQKWEKKHTDKPHPYPLEEDILVFKKQEVKK